MLHKKIILFISTVLICCGIFAASKPVVPVWTYDLKSDFPDALYIAREASAKSAENAKNEAVSQIANYFESHINSDSLSDQRSFQTSGNAEEKYFYTETFSKRVNIVSDVDLFGLQYQFYYDSKNDLHYCAAFINREECWNHFYTKMEAEKKSFYSFLKQAESLEATEPLCAVRDYSKAYNHVIALCNYIDYAGLVLPAKANIYDEDIQEGKLIPSRLKKIKRNCTFVLNVKGDSEDIIRSTIRDLFSNEGFSVRDGGNDAVYEIYVSVDLNVRVDGPSGDDVVYSAVPTIDIEINEGKEILLSYSKNMPKVKFFSADACRKRGISSIQEEVKKTVLKEFYENL